MSLSEKPHSERGYAADATPGLRCFSRLPGRLSGRTLGGLQCISMMRQIEDLVAKVRRASSKQGQSFEQGVAAVSLLRASMGRVEPGSCILIRFADIAGSRCGGEPSVSWAVVVLDKIGVHTGRITARIPPSDRVFHDDRSRPRCKAISRARWERGPCRGDINTRRRLCSHRSNFSGIKVGAGQLPRCRSIWYFHRRHQRPPPRPRRQSFFDGPRQ